MAMIPMEYEGGVDHLFIDISKSSVSLTANTASLVDFTSAVQTQLDAHTDFEYETILFNGIYASNVALYSGRGISSGTNAKKCSVTSSVTGTFYVYAIVVLKRKK